MGTAILRGISKALLVTLLTLLGGVLWETMGLGGISVSSLVDIGLFLSCLIGGYRAGRDGGHWVLGGAAGAGYVGVSTLLLALFAPVSASGVVQVVAEGALLGALGGVIGGGRSGRRGWRTGQEYGTDYRQTGRELDYRYDSKQEGYSHEDMERKYRYEAAERDYRYGATEGDYGYDPSERDNRYDEVELDGNRERADSEHGYRNQDSDVHPWWEEEMGGIKRTG